MPDSVEIPAPVKTKILEAGLRTRTALPMSSCRLTV
jgi:hypothetical protein